MNDNRIITVGRQFGSNGRAIAKKLAELLGIKFYDKELILMAAERSNIHPDRIKDLDEKPVNRWAYAMPGEPVNPAFINTLPVNDVLFEAQCQVIKELAKQEECIIVGRCADYVLKDHALCRNIFIYAPVEERIKVIADRFSLSEKEAKNLIRKTDKQRKYYYNYYTDGRWGEMENYQMTFDSSVLGIDGTAEMLCTMFDSLK